MSDSSPNVTKQTLFISIAVSLLIGFLSGIIFSDKQAPSTNQNSTQQQVVDNSQAIAALEFETAKNPDNGEAWTRLGHAYFDSDQFAKAIMAYNKSLEIIPGDTNVMTDMGVMYRRNGQPSIALETFDKVLLLNPNHEQSLFNKGVVLFYDIKNYEEAINTWKKLVQVNPNATTPSGSPITELIDQLQNQVNKNN
jgi:cytochrome c-type biogenesis protein CcmH/NrfG